MLDASRIQRIFDKFSVASSKRGLNEIVNAAKHKRRSLLARHLLAQHEHVALLLTHVVCSEKSIAGRLLSSEDNFTKNLIAVLGVDADGEIFSIYVFPS